MNSRQKNNSCLLHILLLIALLYPGNNALAKTDLKDLIKACTEATNGTVNQSPLFNGSGETESNTVEIILPQGMDCYTFTSAMTPVMANMSNLGYIWWQPWKIITDNGHMASFLRIKDSFDTFLLLAYYPQGLLSISEIGYKTSGLDSSRLQSMPTLSNSTVYMTISSAVIFTSGFIVNDNIENISDNEWVITSSIQLQKNCNITTLIEQLKSLNFNLIVFDGFNLSKDWYRINNVLATTPDIWACQYSSNKNELIKQIELCYLTESNSLVLRFFCSDNVN